MTIPGSTEEPASPKMPSRSSREYVTPDRPSASRRSPREVDNDVDDSDEIRRPRRRRARDDDADDDDDFRPRRGGRGPRSRWRGQYATCPNCRAPGDATRLSYTLWGGFIGPMIINHVRCNQCGTAYNGNTGKYNTTNIAIFLG